MQEHAGPAAPPTRPLQQRYGRYLAILLVLPLVGLLITLPIGASKAFLRISRRELWHATHYRFVQPPNQDCDVLIAGDSSGMIGLDPHALQSRTGWRTCNLGLPYVPTAIAGTRVLDAYLSHNRAPRFIVFHLAATHLRAPVMDEENGIVDAWLMADQEFPTAEAARLFVTHPLSTLRFASAVWKEFLATKAVLRPDWTGATYERDMREQAAERGWMKQVGTKPDVVCAWQAPQVNIDRAYLDRLIRRYSNADTTAVVWTNPVRDCDVHIADYRRDAAALGLPPLMVYDRTLFVDAYHLNTVGAAMNASALADYLTLRKR